MGPSQDLNDLLRRCTVRLCIPQDGSQGTGFWVAPGLLLTCAHVVETAQARSLPVEIARDGRTVSGRIVAFFAKPYPDLALLRCDELQNHPCVYLNPDIALRDSLYSYGFTDLQPNGDSATFEYEGPTDTGSGSLLKFKEGQSRPGLSGAPLLNLRTGGVCGVVKTSRDRDGDLGGRAVPITCVPPEHDLAALQQSYHQQNDDWLGCLSDEQRRRVPWQTAPSSNPFYGESPTLLGRNEELRRILEKLQANSHCSIVGPPGSGKTLLLQELRQQVKSQFKWRDQEICYLDFRQINSLNELKQGIVQHLHGERPNEIRSLLQHKPLQLLLLDNLGGMETGNQGLRMRRWLRGLEQCHIRLVAVSNERLEILFRKDDPTRDSPFAGLDSSPIELSPLAPAFCHQLVQQRLMGMAFDIALFEDLYSAPRQPRDLLHQCIARYEEPRQHRS